MENMAVREVAVAGKDLMVFLHTENNPTIEEWRGWMKILQDYATKRRGDLSHMRVLVISDGGGPTTVMRDELTKFYSQHSHFIKTAVVTDSIVARGVTTAVSWFNPHLKPFPSRQLKQAILHLDVPESATSAVVREALLLQKELPIRLNVLKNAE